jgi:hypothetical protein
MRPRFSIRTLLVLTALIALLCAWLALPTLSAQQFIRLCETHNFAAADQMLCPQHRFLARWNDAVSNRIDSQDDFQIVLENQDASWIDILRGRRPIGVSQSAQRWNGTWGATLTREARLVYATPFGVTPADDLDQTLDED